MNFVLDVKNGGFLFWQTLGLGEARPKENDCTEGNKFGRGQFVIMGHDGGYFICLSKVKGRWRGVECRT